MNEAYTKVLEWSRYVEALIIVLHRGREVNLSEDRIAEGVFQSEVSDLVRLHRVANKESTSAMVEQFCAQFFWSIWIDQGFFDAILLHEAADADHQRATEHHFTLRMMWQFPKLYNHVGPKQICPAGWLLHHWEWDKDPEQHKAALLEARDFLWGTVKAQSRPAAGEAVMASLKRDLADESAFVSRFPYLL